MPIERFELALQVGCPRSAAAGSRAFQCLHVLPIVPCSTLDLRATTKPPALPCTIPQTHLQIKSRLVDLQARRQDAPPLLSDAAQQAASKQVRAMCCGVATAG